MQKPARLGIKAVPNSSRDAISGWLGSDLKVRVSQPAEDGKANGRICQLLAERLEVPVRDVTVVTGHSSTRKTVEIRGLTLEEAVARLG